MPKPYHRIFVSGLSILSKPAIPGGPPRRHFDVSPSFVVNLMTSYRLRGSLIPKPSAGAATPSSIRTARFFSSLGGKE